MGLERSITLQNATRDQEIAQSRIKQIRAQLLPSVTLSANYLHLDEKPYIGDETGLDNQYDATAGVQQLLFSGGSVSAALKASREYLKYAASATLQRNHALIRDIKQSFYSVLYAESALRVAQQSLKQLKEFETQTRLKFENGTASEFDYLSAQVKVVNERPQVIAAENTLSLARESFKNLIYLNTADFQLTGELEYIPIEVELDHLYELAINRRPELQEQQALIGMRVQDVRATKGSYYPRLYATAAYQGKNPATESLADDEWRWHWTAGVTLSWDIMDSGLRSGEIREKSIELEKSQADLIDLLRGIRLEVKNAYLALQHSRDVVLGTQDSIALAQKALDIADVRYKNGLFTYLEYTDSNLSLTQAQLIHLEALRVYRSAIAELKYACGTEELSK